MANFSGRTLPSDASLLQYKSPFDAFDAHAYTNKDGETAINKNVRDRINDHMEQRGLSNDAWQGDRSDIPPGGEVHISADSWNLPGKAERQELKQQMVDRINAQNPLGKVQAA
jgi:hypothetical protein